MWILSLIGLLTVLSLFLYLLLKLYRYIYPKKYTWDNCPNDHDTMARYEYTKCDKCGSEL